MQSSICFFFTRLHCIRQRNEFDRQLKVVEGSYPQDKICPFDDYVFVDRKAKTFVFANIERILLEGSHGSKDYKRPVEMDHENKEKLVCKVKEFENIPVEDGSQLTLAEKSPVSRKFIDIICHADLHMTNDNILPCPMEQLDVIIAKVRVVLENRNNAPRKAASRHPAVASNFCLETMNRLMA